MLKRFCDICDTRIEDGNGYEHPGQSVVIESFVAHGEKAVSGTKLCVSILWITTRNSQPVGDICLGCLGQALNGSLKVSNGE